MAIVTIEELKAQFVPGQRISSEYFQNLVDTLADDRAAIHIGSNGPTDPESTPIWYNGFDKTLSVYNGSEWVVVVDQPKYNLPKEDGQPGQVLMTDGNGNLTWTNMSLV